MDNQEYQKIIKACRFCLMCRHLCTVGNVTYVETNTPRGKALMLDCYGSEALKETKENKKRMGEVLYECCYCGQCQNNCVSSYRHPDAIMHARADIPDPMLPAGVADIRKLLKKTGQPYEKPVQYPIDKKHADLIEADVLLYLGSFVRNESAGAAKAAIAILEKAGVNYTLLSNEKDSGYYAYELGLPELAAAEAEEEIEKINALKPKKLVTLNPGDFRVFTGGIDIFDVSKLTPKVLHITQYLNELIQSGSLKLKPAGKDKVTYHDSCQLGRFAGDYDSPRAVLTAIPAIQFEELFWNKGEAGCCGAGGGLGYTNQNLADRIAEKRWAQIADKDIQTMVTDCPNCKIQLTKTAMQGVNVESISEFLLKQI